MKVTLLRPFIVVKPVQCENARWKMVVTLLGIVIDDKRLQPRNV